MARTFKGQVHVRIPPDLHREVAQEAFDKDVSISGILAQALLARRILQDIDPWRSIEKAWANNKRTKIETLQADISQAIGAIRASRK